MTVRHSRSYGGPRSKGLFSRKAFQNSERIPCHHSTVAGVTGRSATQEPSFPYLHHDGVTRLALWTPGRDETRTSRLLRRQSWGGRSPCPAGLLPVGVADEVPLRQTLPWTVARVEEGTPRPPGVPVARRGEVGSGRRLLPGTLSRDRCGDGRHEGPLPQGPRWCVPSGCRRGRLESTSGVDPKKEDPRRHQGWTPHKRRVYSCIYEDYFNIYT